MENRMNRLLSIGTLALALAGSSGTLLAANINDGALRVDSAKGALVSFRDMDLQIANISDDAFMMSKETEEMPDAADYQTSRLFEIADEVNRVGQELNAIQTQSNALPAWEAIALNQVGPLMSDVAHHLTDAIHEYDTDRVALRFNGYANQTALIAKDAGEAATLIKEDLASEKSREKEDVLTVPHNPS
jgi:hypothetical protein